MFNFTYTKSNGVINNNGNTINKNNNNRKKCNNSKKGSTNPEVISGIIENIAPLLIDGAIKIISSIANK